MNRTLELVKKLGTKEQIEKFEKTIVLEQNDKGIFEEKKKFVKDYLRRLRDKQSGIVDPISASELQTGLNKFALENNLTSDKFNLTVVQQLADYVLHNECFLKSSVINKPSLKKGIMLIGNIGCGKTTLIDMFRSIQPQFALKGSLFSESFINDKYQINNHKDLFYDDLAVNYSQSSFKDSDNYNKICNIIEQRYLAFKKGHKTHFTTNKVPKELKEIYGERLYSRLVEMCNFIMMTGENLRK